MKKRVADIDWDNPESVAAPGGHGRIHGEGEADRAQAVHDFHRHRGALSGGAAGEQADPGERTPRLENYQDYLEISVVATDAVTGGVAVFNPDCYKVKISSKGMR